MQYVLDQNMSRCHDLSQYLNDGHSIILIDDFFVEIFKANGPTALFQKNIEIIKNYPSSIFYGKNRGELIREEMIRGAPLSAADLLCEESTQNIRSLISLDTSELRLRLYSFKSESEKRASESIDFSEKFIRGLSGKADALDIKKYQYDNDLLEIDICEVAMSVLELGLKNIHGNSFAIENFKSKLSISYIQTYILAWRALNWALKKGYQNAKKICHDNFDLKYVLSSCFFDGLLSKEKWMNDCRNSALSSIKHMINYTSDHNPSVTKANS